MASGTVWPPINYSLFSESSDLAYTDEAINANTLLNGSSQVTKANYYPLGVTGWSVGGSNSNVLSVGRLFLTNRAVGSVTLNYLVYNASNLNLSSQSLRARILWIRAR